MHVAFIAHCSLSLSPAVCEGAERTEESADVRQPVTQLSKAEDGETSDKAASSFYRSNKKKKKKKRRIGTA